MLKISIFDYVLLTLVFFLPVAMDPLPCGFYFFLFEHLFPLVTWKLRLFMHLILFRILMFCVWLSKTDNTREVQIFGFIYEN